jgi:predicted nucleotidyltransferase component of viral defense system
MMSKEYLINQAKTRKYKPEILEKVFKLLSVLKQFLEVPYLRNRIVLKGGTALNLFHFETIPRLSVDIDLNYIGQIDRSQMLEEKPQINNAIYKILEQNQFEFYRHPNHHAGGKMIWQYPSLLGQKGNLEIDLNYMYRQPLWDIEWKLPKLQLDSPFEVPVLDIHELAAGKLSALFSRTVSRDLFDAHFLLTKTKLSTNKLRQTFIIYLSMTDVDIKQLNVGSITSDIRDVNNRLFPVLQQVNLPRKKNELQKWVTKLVIELEQALNIILPLKAEEKEFIHKIRKEGKIEPSLIGAETDLASRILSHPAVIWATKKGK